MSSIERNPTSIHGTFSIRLNPSVSVKCTFFYVTSFKITKTVDILFSASTDEMNKLINKNCTLCFPNILPVLSQDGKS